MKKIEMEELKKIIKNLSYYLKKNKNKVAEREEGERELLFIRLQSIADKYKAAEEKNEIFIYLSVEELGAYNFFVDKEEKNETK